ncbi:unnamed protein product [Parascedosporium putredinis]|uniref:TauD/TfdA-like domain-containing protein n=1 Tax=Parascedosporium putredinis TaxID=1442378 RepID=A0A9P1H1E3_9PEZI|nr:unnamed protein product [Parascedosporium putredinis]CAI7992639.1 unnamed protein product [Parascedosporium putredinis]
MSKYTHFEALPLHATFGAELKGIDWPHINADVVAEIKAAVDEYGVCVLRNTGLDDAAHVEFSKQLGELDNIKRFIHPGRKMRYAHYELFDASNLDENNELLDLNSPRAHANRGNGLFHSDSSYNPAAPPTPSSAPPSSPAGTGGATQFGDSRTALAQLPEPLKSKLLAADYYFADIDPSTFPMVRHRITQLHEQSGRMTLYVGAHLHHIEGLPEEESAALRDQLKAWVGRDENVLTVDWEQPGDLVIWDNRSTVHRALGGEFVGKYKRDLRRTTVHDEGKGAWGLNELAENPSFDMGHKTLARAQPAAPATVTV